MALHRGEDSGGRHELSLTFAVGNGEALMEVALFRCLPLEALVRRYQQTCLLLVEPVGFALFQECYGLGVELLVVDGVADVDGSCDLYADEATVAGRIGKAVCDVGGGNE